MSGGIEVWGVVIWLCVWSVAIYKIGRRDGRPVWPYHDRRRPGYQDRRTGKQRRTVDGRESQTRPAPGAGEERK